MARPNMLNYTLPGSMCQDVQYTNSKSFFAWRPRLDGEAGKGKMVDALNLVAETETQR
jgi:hypothetical protein